MLLAYSYFAIPVYAIWLMKEYLAIFLATNLALTFSFFYAFYYSFFYALTLLSHLNYANTVKS